MAVIVGLAAAGAALTRPTFAILGVALAVWIVIEHRGLAARAVAGASAFTVPVLVVNQLTFGSLMMPYYDAGRAAHGPPDSLVYGLAGQLVSPSRGVLFFMPAVALVSVWGLVVSLRRRDGIVLRGSLAVASIVFLLYMSASPEGWWAGNSYGPRFLVDLVPIAAFLAVPAVERCWSGAASKLLLSVVIAVTAVSVFVQGSGALVRHSACWNTIGGDLYDVGRSRVWDLSESQALYGLRWVLDGNSPLSDGCSRDAAD
jgi:hypothetical protein